VFLLAPRHAEVWKMEVLLHAFWTSALDGGECAQDAVWVSRVARGGSKCCPVGMPRYSSPVRSGRCAQPRERQVQMWCEMGTRWGDCLHFNRDSDKWWFCLHQWEQPSSVFMGVVLWQWRCKAALRGVCRRSFVQLQYCAAYKH